MINEQDLVARLMAGESIDDIMSEITKNVNSALQEKERLDKEAAAKRQAEEDAKRKAEEERKAREAKLNNKKIAVRGLLDAIADLCDIWGWDDIAKECDDATEDDIAELVEMIDSYGEMVKMYAKIGGLTFPLGGSKPKVEKKPEETKAKPVEKKSYTVKAPASSDAEKAILRFLAGNGLI